MVAEVPSDEDAMRMAEFVRTRDRHVYEMLYQKYKNPIFAHVSRFMRDKARAEELTQEVFIRVYTTKRYRPQAKFRTWLYTVATNACLKELKKVEYKQAFDQIGDQDQSAEPLLVSQSSPEGDVASKQLSEALGSALARLSPNQRAAFLMARQDEMRLDEIAEVLNVSVSAVKSLIHRALTALRREAQVFAEGSTRNAEGSAAQ